MNFSIKKMFCAVICGALFLTVVPAQAFSFNFDYVKSFFTPKMAVATAAVAVAGLLVWRYFAQVTPQGIEIQKASDLQNLKDGETYVVKKPFLYGEYEVPVGFYSAKKMRNSKSYVFERKDGRFFIIVYIDNQQVAPSTLSASQEPLELTGNKLNRQSGSSAPQASLEKKESKSEEADEHDSLALLLGVQPQNPLALSSTIHTPPTFNTSPNQSFGALGGSQTWDMPAQPTVIQDLVMLPRVTSLEKGHVFNLIESANSLPVGMYGIINIVPNGENEKKYTLVKIENSVLNSVNAPISPKITVTFRRDNINGQRSDWYIHCNTNTVTPLALPTEQKNSLVTSLDQSFASSSSVNSPIGSQDMSLKDGPINIQNLLMLAQINPLEERTIFRLQNAYNCPNVMTDGGLEKYDGMLAAGRYEITSIVDLASAGNRVKRTLNITNKNNWQTFQITFTRSVNNGNVGEWQTQSLHKDATTFKGNFMADPRNPHPKSDAVANH